MQRIMYSAPRAQTFPATASLSIELTITRSEGTQDTTVADCVEIISGVSHGSHSDLDRNLVMLLACVKICKSYAPPAMVYK